MENQASKNILGSTNWSSSIYKTGESIGKGTDLRRLGGYMLSKRLNKTQNTQRTNIKKENM